MVVGGSAAAGDPNVDFSVARQLEWLLEASDPTRDYEVLNLAYTACNSHVALEVVKQSEAYDLDGIIALVGNNEVIGPYGPATSLTANDLSPLVRSSQIWLAKTRLGQWTKAVGHRLSSNDDVAESWQGMQAFLDHQLERGDPRLERVYQDFRANLQAMAKSAGQRGIPLYLSDVPVNLLDHPPFLSRDDRLSEEQKRELEAVIAGTAAGIEGPTWTERAQEFPQSATVAYVTGRVLHQAGQTREADVHLQRARDLDLLRFRADRRINEIIAELWRDDAGSVRAIEAAAALRRDHPSGTLGFPHFYEHVHFSFRANFLIAQAMAREILRDERTAQVQVEATDWQQAAAALAYTNYEAWLILEEIEQRFSVPPFTEILGYQGLTAWMDGLREALLQNIAQGEVKAQMHQAYIDAIQMRPADAVLQLNLAGFLESFGRTEAALQALEPILEAHPTDSEIALRWFSLAVQAKDPVAAEAALKRIMTIFPQHPNLASMQASLTSLQGP